MPRRSDEGPPRKRSAIKKMTQSAAMRMRTKSIGDIQRISADLSLCLSERFSLVLSPLFH